MFTNKPKLVVKDILMAGYNYRAQSSTFIILIIDNV